MKNNLVQFNSEILDTNSNCNRLITQDNRLIISSYNLELIERRLLYLAISKLYSSDIYDKITIGLHEFRDFYTDNKKLQWSDFKKCTKELYNRNIYNLDGTKQEFTRWIIYMNYDDSTKEVQLSLNYLLKPYFIGLKDNFTTYFLDRIKSLKSIYSVRLYEMLIRFKSLSIFKITVEDYRIRLNLNDKYKTYKNLKSRCITSAIKEINEKTDIYVELLEVKKGRSVHRLEFSFSFKNQTDML